MTGLKKVFIQLGLAMGLALLGALIFFKVYLPATTHHGETLTVPDLEEMNLKEAVEFLESRNLRWAIFDSSYVMEKPPGIVVSQNPKGGTQVKENRRIYLTITPEKAPLITLPNLRDVTLSSASRILKSYGLIPGKIRYKPDLARNVVLETWLENRKVEPGDTLSKGTRIDMVIGDGKGTTRFAMPELAGLTLEEAEYAILGSGLTVGVVVSEVSEEAPLGTVIRSYPTSVNKDIVRLGDRVDLWVSGTIADSDTLR